MTVTHIHPGPRLSEAVVHNGTVYLAGQLGEGPTVTEQTADILAQIDALLAEVGSDKSRILQALIWLKSMDDFPAMNAVWEAWVAPGRTPARATGQVALAGPQYLVEIIVTAACD